MFKLEEEEPSIKITKYFIWRQLANGVMIKVEGRGSVILDSEYMSVEEAEKELFEEFRCEFMPYISDLSLLTMYKLEEIR